MVAMNVIKGFLIGTGIGALFTRRRRSEPPTVLNPDGSAAPRLPSSGKPIVPGQTYNPPAWYTKKYGRPNG